MPGLTSDKRKRMTRAVAPTRCVGQRGPEEVSDRLQHLFRYAWPSVGHRVRSGVKTETVCLCVLTATRILTGPRRASEDESVYSLAPERRARWFRGNGFVFIRVSSVKGLQLGFKGSRCGFVLEVTSGSTFFVFVFFNRQIVIRPL